MGGLGGPLTPVYQRKLEQIVMVIAFDISVCFHAKICCFQLSITLEHH